MIARLLAAYADLHLPLSMQAALLPVLGILCIVLAPVELVLATSARAGERQVLARRQARCPRGHDVPLYPAAWSCPHCGLAFEGHGFAPCPHCARRASAVSCVCGLPCRNPLWDPEEAA